MIMSLLLFLISFNVCLTIAFTAATESVTLLLTRTTTYEEALTNITNIHQNQNARFGKIESDLIDIIRDKYCYRRECRTGKQGSRQCNIRRVGICLRTRLELVSNTSMFIFVREDGLYHNTEASGDYTRIDGENRGDQWYEDYIEEQLELISRTSLCESPQITLEGNRPLTASLESPYECNVCLAESTLARLWHIRIAPWKISFVWCLPTKDNHHICATPWHVVRGENGGWFTMDQLCSDAKKKCNGKQEKVAKSILFTQYIGEFGVTFVAAKTKWVRTLLIALQFLIDGIACTVTNKWIVLALCGIASYFAVATTKKRDKMV